MPSHFVALVLLSCAACAVQATTKRKPVVIKAGVYEPQNPTQIWRSLSRTVKQFPPEWFEVSPQTADLASVKTQGKYLAVYEQDAQNCRFVDSGAACFEAWPECFLTHASSTKLLDLSKLPANLEVGTLASDRASTVFFFLNRMIDVLHAVMKQEGSTRNPLSRRLWPYRVQVAVLPCARMRSQAFAAFPRMDHRNQILVLSKGTEPITLLDALVGENADALVGAMAGYGIVPEDGKMFTDEEIEKIRKNPPSEGLKKVLVEEMHSSYWSSSAVLHEASHIVFHNLIHHPPRVDTGTGDKKYFTPAFPNALDEGLADYLSCAIKFLGRSSVDCVIGGSFERKWWDGLRTAVYSSTKAPHVDNTYKYAVEHGCAKEDKKHCEAHRLGQLIASVLWRAHSDLKGVAAESKRPDTLFQAVKEKAKSILRPSKHIMQNDIRMIKLVLQSLQDSLFSEATLDQNLFTFIILRDCMLSHPELTERQFDAIQHSFTLHGYGPNAQGILGDSSQPLQSDDNVAHRVNFADRKRVYNRCPRVDPLKVLAAVVLDDSDNAAEDSQAQESESELDDKLNQMFQQVLKQDE